MDSPVIYRSYLEYLLHYLSDQGLSTQLAIENCSFIEGALPSAISDKDLQSILRNIETHLSLQAFQVGLNLGFQLSAADHGTVGLASLCSETVAESLQTYSDYFQIISPVFNLICYEEESYFVSETQCEREISSAAYDFLLALGLANGGLIGLNIIDYDPRKHRQKTIMEVSRFPKPNKELWALFKPMAKISFEHERTRLKIPLQVSKQKLATANAKTRASVLALCDAELEKNKNDFINQVTQMIKSQLSAPLNAAQISKEFSLSERSFHRKFKSLNTTYGELCRELKFQEAKKLLKQKDLSIKEIAFALGYSEVTNFSSAFKKSEGLSPKQYQLRLN